jgi:hypothetical protein
MDDLCSETAVMLKEWESYVVMEKVNLPMLPHMFPNRSEPIHLEGGTNSSPTTPPAKSCQRSGQPTATHTIGLTVANSP